mmetsp:Transcript_562/g.1343  ORF Transcript_562/g.1343 Transcript_562/m.1343 type:complete len:221 (+) Transcript_562:167-829(+)
MATHGYGACCTSATRTAASRVGGSGTSRWTTTEDFCTTSAPEPRSSGMNPRATSCSVRCSTAIPCHSPRGIRSGSSSRSPLARAAPSAWCYGQRARLSTHAGSWAYGDGSALSPRRVSKASRSPQGHPLRGHGKQTARAAAVRWECLLRQHALVRRSPPLVPWISGKEPQNMRGTRQIKSILRPRHATALLVRLHPPRSRLPEPRREQKPRCWRTRCVRR